MSFCPVMSSDFGQVNNSFEFGGNTMRLNACCCHLRRVFAGLSLVMVVMGTVDGQTVTIQKPSNVLPDGSAYLMVEGESAFELNDDDPAEQEGFGWVIVDKDDPLLSIAPIDGDFEILPPDTDASGGAAIMTELSGNGTARWHVQFEHPGTYYLYMSWSAYNRDDNPDYLNEDSFYLPPDFNLNSRDDWLGFEGTDLSGDPKEGDSDRDGYIDGIVSLHANVVDKGDVSEHSLTEEQFFEGKFSWFWLSEAVDMDEFNQATGPNGQAIVYEVSEAQVGTVLDFEISSRESYTVIDALLFSTSNELLQNYSQEEMDAFFNFGLGLPGDFDLDGELTAVDMDLLSGAVLANDDNTFFDLNADALVDQTDRGIWVRDLKFTWFGDANLDGEFNSGDLVVVLASGKYEQDVDSEWSSGDFDGNGRSDSGDLVVALSDGGYELGPRAAVQAVPEPSAWLLGLLSLNINGKLDVATLRPPWLSDDRNRRGRPQWLGRSIKRQC
jgi:hypothetical protein